MLIVFGIKRVPSHFVTAITLVCVTIILILLVRTLSVVVIRCAHVCGCFLFSHKQRSQWNVLHPHRRQVPLVSEPGSSIGLEIQVAHGICGTYSVDGVRHRQRIPLVKGATRASFFSVVRASLGVSLRFIWSVQCGFLLFYR